ncbi:MAG: ADP-ribosylglycohydrolase family protein [Bacilli bacterium]|nr:ADP-ribosylglycohydrolase family protein [Bacilli bacterium]
MSKVRDSLLGFAIGDAMGVPFEFTNREDLIKNPITQMTGYGTYNQPEGTWSDDTSMTIATMDAIVTKKEINYKRIMSNFLSWFSVGKYTATGSLFDIGVTCSEALARYSSGSYEPLDCGIDDINSNGNGSLMRMLPIAIYCYYKKLNDDEIINLVNDVSSLTHAHEISKMACLIYVRYVMNLLDDKDKVKAYKNMQSLDYSFYSQETIALFDRVLKDDISKYKLDDISSSGYVVDSLEASLWVILNTESFKQAIIGSINLGNDTDTIGAITGSMAGIIYGYESIPDIWLDKLKKKNYLIKLSMKYEKFLNE